MFSGLTQALIALLLLTATSAFGAQYKGKALNNEKFEAELAIDGASKVDGTVRFRGGKKAVFTARNGVRVDVRVRNICADGHDDRVDVCWPNLKVDIDDLSSRTGVLRIKSQ